MLRRSLERIIQLYTDKSHFVYELLQNAEDAGATGIRFVQYSDRLEVMHDGKSFTTSAYGELIGRRVFHKSKKAYARVVGCDGEYMVLNFESGDKAGQDVKYNLTMCLNNGWIEVVD